MHCAFLYNIISSPSDGLNTPKIVVHQTYRAEGNLGEGRVKTLTTIKPMDCYFCKINLKDEAMDIKLVYRRLTWGESTTNFF
jgi:hypothetical protein